MGADVVFKTVRHGEHQVHNVPHNLYPRGIGPDGKQAYIDGSIMYQLTVIFQQMSVNRIKECEYVDH